MTDGPSIERGFPPTDATLALLNDAYGDWGDEERFRWRYAQYPNFSEQHVFYITVDGNLAAFRRMFDKEIVSDDGTAYEFFGLGDTCVAPDYRGQGLYSALHAATTDYCNEQNRDFSSTFNRKGNLTYEANLKRGWNYRTLPVRVRILSPETVIPQYAEIALEDDGYAESILELIGQRFGLSLAGERIRASELLNECRSSRKRALYFPMPDSVVRALVEVASSEGSIQAAGRHLSPDSAPSLSDGVNVVSYNPPIDETLVRELSELYAGVVPEFDLAFRRDPQDIRHMVDHPWLSKLLIARREGTIVGSAPVTLSWEGNVFEAQVLDLVADDRQSFNNMVHQIESVAKNQGADSIVVLSDRDPGDKWVRVDRQVMMWEGDGPEDGELQQSSLLIGLYDVV